MKPKVLRRLLDWVRSVRLDFRVNASAQAKEGPMLNVFDWQ